MVAKLQLFLGGFIAHKIHSFDRMAMVKTNTLHAVALAPAYHSCPLPSTAPLYHMA